MPTGHDFTDADNAELYDILNPWNGGRFRADAEFYDPLIMAADAVLDVGCGTGLALSAARAAGHAGRLVGIDPDAAFLTRARQCLTGDDEVRESLAAIRGALREGGRFAFETRHPQARAREEWAGSVDDVETPGGGPLRISYIIDAVDGDLVTFTENTAALGADHEIASVVRVEHATLRFLDVPTLNAFLTEAGFSVEEQYGDFLGGPITPESRVIVTVARRV